MANNTRARRTARLSRALGIALTPKAAKYMERRPYGPGEHGRARKKQDSDYAVRLREKQRLRAQYGIREAQMTRAFEEARRTKGLTGENLVELLEMRLDALVLRAGFARTIAQARQLVVHRHIMVDGIRVDRPSFRVGEGQLIHVHSRSEVMAPFQVAAAGAHALNNVPAYLDVKLDALQGPPGSPPEALRGPRDLRRAARRRILRPLNSSSDYKESPWHTPRAFFVGRVLTFFR
ncbi:30S ribosomal protein S4 [Arthrobacter sp. StoSoilB13]|nr:30S ribosomal protein S4 [Arthrobacter sp. StoSoilB13]